MQAPEKINPQLVYLDPCLMDLKRINLGLSRKLLANQARLAVNTVLDVYKSGSGLQPATARKLAESLGCRVTELLAPWDPRYEPPAPSDSHSEWELTAYLEQGRLASNGLYYIVCRMQHRHTPSRSGRGKFYHLSLLSQAVRDGIQTKLSRHPEVSTRVGPHPNVIFNLSSISAGNAGWWVIDTWCGEKTLADHLQDGHWPREKLPRLLLDIAQGLEALHGAGIVFRELAPSRVLIADDGRAVLTDFELAKLLDGSPSVSSEWPEDPFRAPEIDGGQVTERADLYSLSALTAAAVSGRMPETGAAKAILADVDLPKRLGGLLSKCVEPIPDRRPAGLAPLLKELTRWAEK